jgi:eukaryotic-like serine/threonine-protein kinase
VTDPPRLSIFGDVVSVDEHLPRALGPYLLLARIGRGGMGDVYLARHGMLSGFEKHCVLKMLRDDRANDPDLLARFAEEARVVVQLGHRNICPVFDVGRVGDRLYVVLEHIVGRDLRTVAMVRPLPLAVALHIVGEVCEALDYAHRFVDRTTGAPLGLVHRDVSPHNVLLGVDGDTKLIDFGIATTRVTAAPSQEVLGKLTYMSPEHARGEVVDHRADQFSTAVMLTELVLAERFHEGLGTEQVRQLVGEGTWRPARFRTAIEPGLAAIIDRALSPRAVDRWPSMADFADALSAWATAHTAIATPRDVRRHLLAVCGDLAAEHRALLQSLEDTAVPDPAADVPAPGLVEDDGQFESIATTLAAPVHTPAFGSVPATLLVERTLPPLPPTLAAPSTTTTAQPAASSMSALRVGLAAIVGVALGVGIGTSIARDAPTAVSIVDIPLPEVQPPGTLPSPAPEPPSPTPPPPPPASPEADVLHADDALVPTLSPAGPAPPPPVPSPAPSTSIRRSSFDAATTRSLTALRECVDKVPCARGVLEWSVRSGLSDTERVELKDAASACVKRCRLK